MQTNHEPSQSPRALALLALLTLGACGLEPSPEVAGAAAPSAQHTTTPATEPAASEPQSKESQSMPNEDPALPTSGLASKELATLGAGCFWCVEAVYEQLPGVHGAVSGYMGGTVDNPTYEQVCGKQTGHIEVVQVEFDPRVITYAEVLDWFWRLHDPTSLDRQGADAGPQYRSAVFFHSPEQERIARESLAAAQPSFSKPIVTEVRAASTLWTAEGYHQGYYFDNPGAGYCRMVIAPKLDKLGLKK